MKLQQNRSINEGARAMTMFSSDNSHCDLDLGPRTLKLKIHQDIVILHICGKLNQNRSIYEGSRAMTMFFLKTATVTLILDITICQIPNLIYDVHT